MSLFGRGCICPRDSAPSLPISRVLVVEYKSGGIDAGWYAMPDSEEKRAVRAVWESWSGGKCLFIMPPGRDFEAIRRKVQRPEP